MSAVNYLSFPKLQRWSLGMDKHFHLTVCWAFDYLTMPGLKLTPYRQIGILVIAAGSVYTVVQNDLQRKKTIPWATYTVVYPKSNCLFNSLFKPTTKYSSNCTTGSSWGKSIRDRWIPLFSKMVDNAERMWIIHPIYSVVGGINVQRAATGIVWRKIWIWNEQNTIFIVFFTHHRCIWQTSNEPVQDTLTPRGSHFQTFAPPGEEDKTVMSPWWPLPELLISYPLISLVIGIHVKIQWFCPTIFVFILQNV